MREAKSGDGKIPDRIPKNNTGETESLSRLSLSPLAFKPSPSKNPVVLHVVVGNSQDLPRFLLRAAQEIPQLPPSPLAGMPGRRVVEHLMPRQHFGRVAGGCPFPQPDSGLCPYCLAAIFQALFSADILN